MTERKLIFYIDYLCPYAWRFAELVLHAAEELQYTPESRHFSLYQHNVSPEELGADWQIWNEPLDETDEYGSKGLLPFLAATAARRQGQDAFETYRLELQRARHVRHLPFTTETMNNVADHVGLDMLTFARDLRDPELRTQFAQDHLAAKRLNVAGTPTVQFGDDHVAYVRLETIPTSHAEQVRFLGGLLEFMQEYPELATLRRAKKLAN